VTTCPGTTFCALPTKLAVPEGYMSRTPAPVAVAFDTSNANELPKLTSATLVGPAPAPPPVKKPPQPEASTSASGFASTFVGVTCAVHAPSLPSPKKPGVESSAIPFWSRTRSALSM
jgi:hypothetical protein